MEVLTDSRLKPEEPPKTDPTDAILQSLSQIVRQLDMIFWAIGGPMAIQEKQQLYMAYHPEARPEQSKIVVPK